MMQSGFTHRFNGEPIPLRSEPYEANFKAACTDAGKLAKAIKRMPIQTFKSSKPANFYTKGVTNEKANTKTTSPKVIKKLDVSNPGA
jgi:hypothetical protein